MNINDIISLLSKEIESLETEEKKEKENKCLIDMINSALENISGDNYIDMKTSNEFTPIIFDIIYCDDKEKSERLSNKLLNCLHQLAYLQTNEENYKRDNSFISQEKKLTSIRKELNDTLTSLKTNLSPDMNEKINKIKSYRIIRGLFRYNQIINAKEISEISALMKKNNISPPDQISALEHIKLHNIKISEKMINTRSRIADKYTVLNMLSRGLEYIEEPVLKSDSEQTALTEQKRIEGIAKAYLNSINNKDNKIVPIIDGFPKLSDGIYSYEEFDAIMKYILIEIQNNILSNIEMIKQKDFYMDNNTREMIISGYNMLSMKYSVIRQYHIDELNKYEKSIEDKESPEEESINKLFYATVGGKEGNKTYLEKDIETIPEEYLYKVKMLLNKLKQDNLSKNEIKKLSNNKNIKGLAELRDDQIRIILYHLSSNNYLIIGCGDKRSNNDVALYRKMGNRNKTLDIETTEDYQRNLKTSEEVERRIDEFIESHQRKGTR